MRHIGVLIAISVAPVWCAELKTFDPQTFNMPQILGFADKTGTFNPKVLNVPNLLNKGLEERAASSPQVQFRADGNSCVIPMPTARGDAKMDGAILRPQKAPEPMPKLKGLPACSKSR